MRKPTIKQYSKRVVSAMVLAWFVGIAFGMGVVVWQMIRAPDVVSLDSLLTYIGAPMGCGIAGYLAKSAFENREKIRAQYIPEYDEKMTEEEYHEENRLGEEADKP
jgi:hypothetical protein|nr:MAG TPA: hypothetical protein [Caudoviricetes sp.]